mgnify:CR=1 FL=1
MYFTAKTLMQIMPARVIRKNKREGKVQMLRQSTFRLSVPRLIPIMIPMSISRKPTGMRIRSCLFRREMSFFVPVIIIFQTTFPDPETAHSTAPLIKNTFLKRIAINIMATLKKMTGNASNSASDKGKSS